jgi:hypothetical protein
MRNIQLSKGGSLDPVEEMVSFSASWNEFARVRLLFTARLVKSGDPSYYSCNHEKDRHN